MANEITSTVNLNCTKGSVSKTLAATGQISQAGVNTKQWTQTIATSATALDLGSLTGTPPAILIKNLDVANFLQVDSNNTFTNFPQKIRPGCAIILYPQTTTIYLKADTAAVQVDCEAMEP